MIEELKKWLETERCEAMLSAMKLAGNGKHIGSSMWLAQAASLENVKRKIAELEESAMIESWSDEGGGK